MSNAGFVILCLNYISEVFEIELLNYCNKKNN